MHGRASKAVIYTRVSSDRQIENTSLTEQHAACMAKAKAIGAQVVGSYEDPGVSGGLYLARPGIQQALADLESGKANTLIIPKLDRCSRDREHLSAIKKRVERAGARLVFCDMDFAESPEGNLQLGILADFVEYERMVIRDRCMKGARRRAQEGVQTKTAMRPYGYYIPKKQDVLLGLYSADQYGKYQFVTEEVQWVSAMFTRAAQGESLHSIARWLNEQGVPTPRRGEFWRCSTIKRILNNPVYKGKAAYGRHERLLDESLLQKGYKQPFLLRETPEDRWIYIDAPALVEEHIWETCQQALQENKSRHGGRPDRKYTLAGLLRCPKCGKTMHGTKRMQKPSPSRIAKQQYKPLLRYVYACRDSRPSRNTGGHQCNPRNYNGSKAERAVFAAIDCAAKCPKAIEAALQAYHETKAKSYSEVDYQALKHELKGLQKREEATIEAQIRGMQCGANVTVYEDLLRQISNNRTQLERRLNEMAAQRAAVTDVDASSEAQIISDVLQVVNEVLEAPELTDNEKRELLSRVVESVYPTDDLNTYEVNLKPFTKDALTVANVSTLCPPLAATSRARLTVSWPLTSDQSTSECGAFRASSESSCQTGSRPPLLSKSMASAKLSTGKTCNPSTTAASRALSLGTMSEVLPAALAPSAMGNTPLTGRTAPSNPSSPTAAKFSKCALRNCSSPSNAPRAIGKSKMGPCFLVSAGARLTVMRRMGQVNCEFLTAARTRSPDSRTEASGKPTIAND
jgi:site-specific DNA recombinase